MSRGDGISWRDAGSLFAVADGDMAFISHATYAIRPQIECNSKAIYIDVLTQCSIAACGIAPDWRATSTPFLNKIRVGMLRIPKRAASAGCASVSTLPKRTCGSSFCAAAANAGAMVRHGPHQGAQKSTSNGRADRSAWRLKLASVRTTGAPENSGCLHWPHVPVLSPPANRTAGRRFNVWQCGQAIICVSDLCGSVILSFHGLYDSEPYIGATVKKSSFAA